MGKLKEVNLPIYFCLKMNLPFSKLDVMQLFSVYINFL